MALSPLHRRLKAAIGERTFREVGDLTNTNHETVRRYVQGQSPSVEFLSALCEALKINGAWLLMGQGPMHAGDARGHALQEANPHELLAAVADTLERLNDRVTRIELFVQTIETRLRAIHEQAPPPEVLTASASVRHALSHAATSLAGMEVKLVDSAHRDGFVFSHQSQPRLEPRPEAPHAASVSAPRARSIADAIADGRGGGSPVQPQ